MKIEMKIVIELDSNLFGNTRQEILWLENEILIGNRSLIIHSN